MKRIHLLLIPLLLAGCTHPSITAERISAPAFRDASRLRTLALLPLEGDEGGSFTAAVEEALRGVRIDNHPYFALARKESVATAASELGMNTGTLPEVETIRAVGSRLGVEGVLAGTVVTEVNRRTTRERRTYCRNVGDDGGCNLWGDREIPCTLQETRVVFTPRLVDVATGKAVHTGAVTGKSGSLTCADTAARPPEPETLRDRAEARAISTFLHDIAPSFIPRDLPIMDSSAGMPSGEGRDLFTRGIILAEQGKGNQACPLWQRAEPFAPSAPALVFNLGVCAEAQGDLALARDRYRHAANLIPAPTEIVTDALSRVETEIRRRAALTGTGIEKK